LVVPSKVFGTAEAGPRAVVFLLDRAGARGGEPIEQAKRGMRACLGALNAEDWFGIVAFDSTPEAFQPGLEAATSAVRAAALKFLDAVEVQGGTELAAGVRAAAQVLGRKGVT
jgi:Ca-activated chloride channel family protein